jgi:hypothetical protein
MSGVKPHESDVHLERCEEKESNHNLRFYTDTSLRRQEKAIKTVH